jgi:hypothetical protein
LNSSIYVFETHAIISICCANIHHAKFRLLGCGSQHNNPICTTRVDILFSSMHQTPPEVWIYYPQHGVGDRSPASIMRGQYIPD